VKGHIDISRHIRQNIPFAGNIAYKTREYAQDNHLTQLIRHTIEYISRHRYSGNILQNDEDTSDAIKAICQATESYNRNERQRVINQNLRPISHPFYSEYRPLQQLCLQILRQEEMKYGRDDEEIYGVLFDGAWLWEEYLNTILKDCGFEHPQNKMFKGKKPLFVDGSAPRYPDFYKMDMVLDAKYKRYANLKLQKIDEDDLHQVITYMYILAANHGGFIVPWPYSLRDYKPVPKILNGYGGSMNIYGITVDSPVNSYKEYCSLMAQYEREFRAIFK
jgi:5-methylcytosine-specific restriction endonuclease McrBC regulatory subunit McrC